MTRPAADGLRRLPTRRTSTCRRCKRPVVFAVTVAGENGPGGKSMPLDLVEAADGNTAVRPGPGGRLLARVLRKDEHHSPPVEYLAMPHFATCPGAPGEPNPRLPAEVADLAAHRARNAQREPSR